MKRNILVLLMAFIMVFAFVGGSAESMSPLRAAVNFDASKEISVVSREDGSGTRSAFVELMGILEKDANGNKVDKTTVEAIIANKTDIMLTTVAGDQNAIGYVSLGSLNNTVKALTIGGVAATAQTIKDGTYTVSRPFNIATTGEPTGLPKDFLAFIMSMEGQAVVANSYIAVNDTATAFTSDMSEGKIVIGGSSSVSPLMEKLVEAYLAINTKAQIEIQTSDSTAGMTGTIDGNFTIGMASRELKDSEKEKLTAVAIAMDGIAVIVNNENPLVNLTTEQVKEIFVGNAFKWSDVYNFDTSSEISVVSREDGSGTRGAFTELMGILEKDANGNKVDKTTVEAIIANKTDVMLTTVAGNQNAIGYVSLGSLNSSIRALTIDGIAATPETIKDGTYAVARPFNIATVGEPTGVAKDLLAFIMSSEGQAIVGTSYITVNDAAEAFTSDMSEGKIVVGGSSSVSPLMEKLVEAYLAINTKAQIEIQTSDSTAGMTGAIDGNFNICMASRELKDSEKEKLTGVAIAMDGIAVIVNNESPLVNLTTEQVKEIFVGNALTWASIK